MCKTIILLPQLLYYYDSLLTLLSELQHNFSIIGLTETKIKADIDHIANTLTPGYQFLSKPALDETGGVGFYIRDGIEFHLRDDLCVATNDFECSWIEIHCTTQNIVCAVIYRHPNGNLDNFTNYFYEA